jgi:hypothetical protein
MFDHLQRHIVFKLILIILLSLLKDCGQDYCEYYAVNDNKYSRKVSQVLQPLFDLEIDFWGISQ